MQICTETIADFAGSIYSDFVITELPLTYNPIYFNACLTGA